MATGPVKSSSYRLANLTLCTAQGATIRELHGCALVAGVNELVVFF